MPLAPVILLEQARNKREQAARARTLADALFNDAAVASLRTYAEELEQSACELEDRAIALTETIANTHGLTADIKRLIEEARAQIKASRKLLHPKKPKTD